VLLPLRVSPRLLQASDDPMPAAQDLQEGLGS